MINDTEKKCCGFVNILKEMIADHPWVWVTHAFFLGVFLGYKKSRKGYEEVEIVE